jgi:peptidoglycan/xylan/chitin deacetylase (PgdA/CDA1 family)
MRSLLLALTLASFSCGTLLAQQAPPVSKEDAPKAVPLAPAPVSIPDDGVRVAVLGYHDFSNTLKETEMRINTTKFRAQMQAIKDQGLTVVSMADFTAWRKGEKELAPKSVLITIDDGWLSVYTDAYPILKEFGYPFTVYLYTKYVDVGGKSMTLAMIREMQKNGMTLGNHSKSHHFPTTVKSQKRKGTKSYEQYLEQEMNQSKVFLEKTFSQKINSYCYPGGYSTDEMFVAGKKYGYENLFTVLPGKIKRSSDGNTLPRYIILGTYDKIFVTATEFRDASAVAAAGLANAPKQIVPYPVLPEPGAVVNTRMPLISADLSTVADIKPETLLMKVAGFGDVPAVWDETSKHYTWQINRRLRSDSCQVSITWKTKDDKTITTPLRWTFIIDKEAAYQPSAD